jgi:hypothetical protein
MDYIAYLHKDRKSDFADDPLMKHAAAFLVSTRQTPAPPRVLNSTPSGT